MALAAVPTYSIRDVILESFTEDATDGYFYPQEPGTPLVRVYLGGDGYVIERRRNSRGDWYPVVTARVEEFDPQAFRVWRTAWPVVEPA